jgi:hypothetical protein
MRIRNDRDLIVQASSCSIKGVYFIGPYGARVSFASQQRRVLNLIWALKQKDWWPKGTLPRVVIIGGGIAGITAAAAAKLQGCAVAIYEAAGSVLALQQDASHRYVHPTINFWPEEDLAWTTTLPFFDWCAGSCDDVLGCIGAQWEEWFEEHISEVVDNARFAGFGPKRGGKVIVKLGSGKEDLADIVFVTTGFGPERHHYDPRLKSYWKPDDLNDWATVKEKQFTVSGTGDGGLIDTLRIAYPFFMRNALALRFLYALDPETKEAVKEIEIEAEGKSGVERLASFYNRRYTEVARNQPQRVKALLPIPPEGKQPVRLIGQFSAPYEQSSAPVHKLILALAIHLGHVDFVQGKVVPKKAVGEYWLERDGSAPELLDLDRLVVRHGAEPPIEKFIGESAARGLANRQRQLGDYLKLDGYDEAEYFDKLFIDKHTSIVPGRTRAPGAFADLRNPIAQKLLDSKFGLNLKTVGHIFQIVVGEHQKPKATGEFGPVPDQLFGIPLAPASSPIPPMDELTGVRSA